MTPTDITDEMLATYRRDGVIKIPQIISSDEVAKFRQASLDILEAMPKDPNRPFNQKVNVWREDEVLRNLTQHPNVAAVAEKIAGVRLRIWARSHPGQNARTRGTNSIPPRSRKMALMTAIPMPYRRGSHCRIHP